MPEHRARVLMTLADVAWPVDAGKRLRAASMVRAVAEHCDVDVVVLFADADPAARPIPPDVEGRWQSIGASPRPAARAGLDLIRHLAPWQIAVHDWPGVQRRLAARDGGYDLIWFGALDHFSRLRSTLRAPRVVVDCDDVETEKLSRFLALPPSAALPWADRVQRRIERPMWGHIQRQAVHAADAVLVCSELDRSRLIAQAAPKDAAAAARVHSIANTYPEPADVRVHEPQGRCTLAVIANYGTDQNLDAVHFVADQLLGPLRQAVPGARIRLVGRRADRLAEFGDIEGLDLVGPVDSVAEELSRAHAVLVPIRFGGGTRLKIVEALAYGVPVVSTVAGAEGIDATDGEQLLIGDTPQQIVASVCRVLDEPGLAQRLSGAGRALYERSYRPQATMDAVGALLGQVLRPAAGRTGVAHPRGAGRQ